MSITNIFIRPISLSDVTERYVSWLNDPEVNQYLETKYVTQTSDMVANFVQSKINSLSEFLFAICLESGEHIGNIKIGPINTHHLSADVSLFIGDKSVWGKGCASQAIYLISEFGFKEKKLQKLKAGCYENNIGSAKAFEKCGYIREGVLRKEILLNGSRINSWQFGVLPNELKRPKS